MKRHLFSLLVGTLIATSLFGQSVRVLAQVDVQVKKSVSGLTNPIVVGERILVDEDSKPVVADVGLITIDQTWKFSLIKAKRDGKRVDLVDAGDGRKLAVGAGKWTLDCTLFDPSDDKGIWNEEFYFELAGGVAPAPDPEPPPPGPQPDPVDPPTPQPPAPIPVEGFRVLVIYETSTAMQLPAGQRAILTDQSLRNYLNRKCVPGPDGRTPEYRFFDQDTYFPPTCDLVWCKAMQRKRDGIPWLIISDGKTGYEGPLPQTLSDMMTLLKKYGGD